MTGSWHRWLDKNVTLASIGDRIAMATALRGPGARLPGEEDDSYVRRQGASSAAVLVAVRGPLPAFVTEARPR